MAALSITAANVLKGSGVSIENGTAGATITAGQLVYLDSSTNTYKLTDTDVVASASARGIALHGSLSGQPLQILMNGPITIGATLTAGNVLYASPTAGGITATVADLVSTNRVIVVGVATSTTVAQIQIIDSTAVL